MTTYTSSLHTINKLNSEYFFKSNFSNRFCFVSVTKRVPNVNISIFYILLIEGILVLSIRMQHPEIMIRDPKFSSEAFDQREILRHLSNTIRIENVCDQAIF